MNREAIEKAVKRGDSYPVIKFLMSPHGRKYSPPLRAALVSAIEAPNRPLLDTLLDPRSKLDLASALESCHALWLATKAGDIALMHRLLDAGGNVDAPGREGATPLLAAAAVCNLPAATLLLERGASVRETDATDRNVLHLAANTGPVHKHRSDITEMPLSPPAEFARLLIAFKAEIEATDETGATPLMTAALRGNLEMVQALLEHGAYVQMSDKAGRTALHYVALARITTTIGEQTEYPTFPAGPIVRLLVEHGANVRHASLQGDTPLHDAAEQGNLSAARALLESGANVHARDVSGATPLMRAATARTITCEQEWRRTQPQDRASDLIYVLMEHGADVRARDLDGNSALDRAVELRQTDAIEALRVCGARKEDLDAS